MTTAHCRNRRLYGIFAALLFSLLACSQQTNDSPPPTLDSLEIVLEHSSLRMGESMLLRALLQAPDDAVRALLWEVTPPERALLRSGRSSLEGGSIELVAQGLGEVRVTVRSAVSDAVQASATLSIVAADSPELGFESEDANNAPKLEPDSLRVAAENDQDAASLLAWLQQAVQQSRDPDAAADSLAPLIDHMQRLLEAESLPQNNIQDDQAAALCLFNITTGETLLGSCADPEEDAVISVHAREDGRALVRVWPLPSRYQAAHYLLFYSQNHAPRGWTFNLGNSLENRGFGGSDSDPNNAELQVLENALSVYSQASRPQDLQRAGPFRPGIASGTIVHSRVADQQLAWQCWGGGCDSGLQTVSFPGRDGLFRLSAAEEQPVLWAGFNRVIASEATLSTPTRLGVGAAYALIWLRPRQAAPLPDLVLRELRFDEACDLTFVLENIGDAAARSDFSFQASPVLRRGDAAENASTLWGAAIPGLAAQSSSEQHWRDVRVAGGHIDVSIDPEQRIAESNTSNNNSRFPVPEACRVTAEPTPEAAFDLRLSQAQEGSLRVGEEVRYLLQISNEGPDPVPGAIRLEQTLPRGLRFVALEPASAAAWDCALSDASDSSDPSNRTDGALLRCRYQGQLPAPQGRLPELSFRVVVLEDAPEEIESCAEVFATGDRNPDNNRRCLRSAVRRPAPIRFALSLEKSLSGSLRVAQSALYVLQVSNEGPAQAQGAISLRDTLPPGVRWQAEQSSHADWDCRSLGFLAADNIANNDGFANNFANNAVATNTSDTAPEMLAETVHCDYQGARPVPVGSLPDVRLSVWPLPNILDTLPATVRDGLRDGAAELPAVFIENCALLRSQASGVDNGEDVRACSRDRLQLPRYDLSLEKSLSGSLRPGASARYVIQVSNRGPDLASEALSLRVNLAQGLRLRDNLSSEHWRCGLEPSSDSDAPESLLCHYRPAPPLPLGALRDLVLQVQVEDFAEVPTEALQSCASLLLRYDSNPDNDRDCVDAALNVPDDSVTMRLEQVLEGPLESLRPVFYTLQASNLGPGSLRQAPSLVLDVPQGSRWLASQAEDDVWRCEQVAADNDDNDAADNNDAATSEASPAQVHCRYHGDLPVMVGSMPALRLEFFIDAAAEQNLRSCAAIVYNDNRFQSCRDDRVVPPAEPRATLTLSKNLSGRLEVGQEAEYVLQVRNLGADALPLEAMTLSVQETFPQGLRFLTSPSPAWQCETVVDDVTDAVTDVAVDDAPTILRCRFLPDESQRFEVGSLPRLVLRVAVEDDAPERVDNCARLQLAGVDDLPASLEPDSRLEVCHSAEVLRPAPVSLFSLDMNLAAPLVAGQESHYLLQVSNLGPDPAEDTALTLTHTLPSGLRFVRSEGDMWQCEAAVAEANQSQRLRCRYTQTARIPVGELTPLRLHVRVTAPPNTEMESCAQLDAPYHNDAAPLCQRASVSAPPFDLRISKSLLGELLLSQSAHYRLRVENLGPGSIYSAVRVEDTLPVGLRFQGSASPSWQCSSDNAQPETVTCLYQSDSPVPPGDIEALQLEVKVIEHQRDEVENCAAVYADAARNSGVQSCIRSPVLRARYNLRLEAELMTPAPALAGSQARISWNVENLGPTPVPADQRLELQHQLPEGMLFVDNSPAWQCDVLEAAEIATGQQLRCHYLQGSVDVGRPEPLELNVLLEEDARGRLEYCAELFADADSNPDDNRACIAVDVDNPRVDLRLEQNLRDPLREGATVRYLLSMHNQGPGDIADLAATPITLLSYVPAGLRLISSSNDAWQCAFDSDDVPELSARFADLLLDADFNEDNAGSGNVWQLLRCRYQGEALATAGQQSELELSLLVEAAAGETLTLCSELLYAPDSNPDNNRSCSSDNVLSGFALSLNKSLQGQLEVGNTAAYLIEVRNEGPQLAQGDIIVSDILPAGLTFNTNASPDAWQCTLSSTSGSSSSSSSSDTGDGTTLLRCHYLLANSDIPIGRLNNLIISVNVRDDAPANIRNCATLLSPDGTLESCTENSVQR